MGLALGGCLATLLWLRTAPAQTVSARERAQELFQKGNETFAEGNTFEAYDAYVRAFSLSPSFDIACNLGRSEVEMGKLREGAGHLRYCLKNFSASSRAELRQAQARFGDLLSKVKAQVLEVDFDVSPPGASVSVNGELLGKAPFLDTVFLLPGKVTLVVSKPGYQAESFSLIAQAGSRQQMKVQLPIAASQSERSSPVVPRTQTNPGTQRSAGTEASAEFPPARSSSQLRTGLLIGGAAATVVTLGVGTYFAVQSGDQHAAFRAQRSRIQQELGSEGCLGTTPLPECQELNQLRTTAAEKDRVSLVALAGASGFGLATTALWLLWAPPQRGVEVALVAGRRHAGFVVEGAF